MGTTSPIIMGFPIHIVFLARNSFSKEYLFLFYHDIAPKYNFGNGVGGSGQYSYYRNHPSVWMIAEFYINIHFTHNHMH